MPLGGNRKHPRRLDREKNLPYWVLAHGQSECPGEECVRPPIYVTSETVPVRTPSVRQ